MWLCVDAGNTRIKWALWDGQAWQQTGQCLTRQAATLEWRDLPATAVWVANVAGPEVEQQLQRAADEQGWPLHLLRSTTRWGSLENGYARPAQLGVDRWLAAVAAWQHVRQACVVVNCGTATTIDSIAASGRFLGGLIVPGLNLMQNSLCANTAQLQTGAGQYRAFPDNTADALFSGAIQATLGAIQRQHALLPAAQLLLTGGAATLLRPHLPQAIWREDLVLQGIRLIAAGKEAA